MNSGCLLYYSLDILSPPCKGGGGGGGGGRRGEGG